jgi:hypothetical protein
MNCSYCGLPVDQWYADEGCPASPSGYHTATPPADHERVIEVKAEPSDPRGPSPMRGAYAAWLVREDARRRVPAFLLPRGDEIAGREYFESVIEPRETEIEEGEEDARASREEDERQFGPLPDPDECVSPAGVEEGHDLDLAEVFGLEGDEYEAADACGVGREAREMDRTAEDLADRMKGGS